MAMHCRADSLAGAIHIYGLIVFDRIQSREKINNAAVQLFASVGRCLTEPRAERSVSSRVQLNSVNQFHTVNYLENHTFGDSEQRPTAKEKP